MDEGSVNTARIPLNDEGSDRMISAESLCERTVDLMVRDNTKLLFVFSPEQFRAQESH